MTHVHIEKAKMSRNKDKAKRGQNKKQNKTVSKSVQQNKTYEQENL